MILTCPTCASQYSVDDAKLSDRPRTVRCVACKATWTASPPEKAVAAPPPVLAPEPASFAPAAKTSPGPSPELGSDATLSTAFRAKAVAKQRTREAVAAGVVWGGLGAALLVLVASALLFRVDVVRLWPRTAGAYAKVGMPVNPLGLTPENVEAGTGLIDGRAAVVVTGQLRNIQTRAQPAQPLRVALLDKNGKRLAVQVAAAAPGLIPPDGVRAFSVQFIDPPAASKDVEVEFAFDLISAKPHAAAAAPHPIKVSADHAPARPTAVKLAEPLPDHSPDALPAAAGGNNPAHDPHEG